MFGIDCSLQLVLFSLFDHIYIWIWWLKLLINITAATADKVEMRIVDEPTSYSWQNKWATYLTVRAVLVVIHGMLSYILKLPLVWTDNCAPGLEISDSCNVISFLCSHLSSDQLKVVCKQCTSIQTVLHFEVANLHQFTDQSMRTCLGYYQYL